MRRSAKKRNLPVVTMVTTTNTYGETILLPFVKIPELSVSVSYVCQYPMILYAEELIIISGPDQKPSSLPLWKLRHPQMSPRIYMNAVLANWVLHQEVGVGGVTPTRFNRSVLIRM